jgi:hypothetical protein
MSVSDQGRTPGKAKRWQFSLATLLIAMTCAALVCIALRNPNELWSSLIFILMTASLLVAALLIIYRGGRTRAFAVGFLIFGAAYLCVSEHQIRDANTSLATTRWAIELFGLLHGNGGILPYAMATPVYAPQPLAYTFPVVPATQAATFTEEVAVETPVPPTAGSAPIAIPPSPTPYAPPAVAQTVRIVTRTVPQPMVSMVSPISFLEVFHHSLVMLLGLVGGIIAQMLYATRRDEQTPPRQPA